MPKIKLVSAVVISLVAGLLLSACKGNTDVNLTTSGENALSQGITVNGVGEVKATPDLAIVTIGVEVSGTTVAETNENGATAAANLIDSIKGSGVDAKDIQTTGVALNPRYEYSSNGGTPKIVGYTSSNSLQVTLRDLESSGKIIDAALRAAGDAGRLNGIQFGFSDQEPLLAEARQKAMENAKARAKAFADGAGVKVGDVLAITETTTTDPVYFRSLGAADIASTPIEPGQSATTVSVTVRYAIDR